MHIYQRLDFPVGVENLASRDRSKWMQVLEDWSFMFLMVPLANPSWHWRAHSRFYPWFILRSIIRGSVVNFGLAHYQRDNVLSGRSELLQRKPLQRGLRLAWRTPTTTPCGNTRGSVEMRSVTFSKLYLENFQCIILNILKILFMFVPDLLGQRKLAN